MADELYYEDVDFGDEVGPVERVVRVEQVRRFLNIQERSDSDNRFTSDEAAKKEGLPGPIVPGAMNIAMMSQLLTGWSPSIRLQSIDVVFRGMVPHNQSLKLSGIVTDKNIVEGSPQLQCDVFLENEKGVKLVIGNAVVALPAREQG